MDLTQLGSLETNQFGLFDTVVGGPAAVPYSVGWALLVLGTVWSLIVCQLKNMSGQRADPLQTLVTSGVLAAVLSLYTVIAKNTWWATQTIAHEIYPDTKMSELASMLKALASRFQQYSFSFSLTDLAQGIKDSVVSFTGLGSWLLALLAHYEIQQMQAAVWNVVFCFGPLLIGLAAFGLQTARVWFTALLEVSSWSISAAVIYRGLSSTFQSYLAQAQQAGALDGHFLDVIENLVFLSSLMFVVPIVTGRLLGMATLGELARISSGNNWAAGAAGMLRRMQSDYGPRADTPDVRAAGFAAQASASPRRPGD